MEIIKILIPIVIIFLLYHTHPSVVIPRPNSVHYINLYKIWHMTEVPTCGCAGDNVKKLPNYPMFISVIFIPSIFGLKILYPSLLI